MWPHLFFEANKSRCLSRVSNLPLPLIHLHPFVSIPHSQPAMGRVTAVRVARATRLGLQRAQLSHWMSPSISPSFISISTHLKASIIIPIPTRRFLSSSSSLKGITPDNKPRDSSGIEKSPKPATKPADITTAEYHRLADEYLDALLSRLEELQDEREDVDVEYQVCLYPLWRFPFCFLADMNSRVS